MFNQPLPPTKEEEEEKDLNGIKGIVTKNATCSLLLILVLLYILLFIEIKMMKMPASFSGQYKIVGLFCYFD